MRKIILVFLLFVLCVPVFAQNNWSHSISDKEKIESELKIYPNPCKNGKISIDFQSKKIREIRLTNITGKEIIHKKYDAFTHKTQMQLNDIPNGIYLIRIKSTDNQTFVKKLMVSKN